MSSLTNRGVISVRGPHATDLLQNVMSQDIELLEKESPDRAALFTTFMNAKGKILFDGIVVKPKLAA